MKFRTSCFTSRSDFDEEQKKLRVGAEVLVATPGRLLDLLKRKQVIFDDLQTVILDEVDSLYLDQAQPLEPIGAACPPQTQFLFTSATLPAEMVAKIQQEFPTAINLSGPGLHRVAPHVTEVLIDCSGPFHQQKKSHEIVLRNKFAALDKALMDHSKVERTIIFCNTIEQCRNVENHLKREDRSGRLRTLHIYHSAIADEDRDKGLTEFSKILLKQPAVLICTDRASRGMDFNKAFVSSFHWHLFKLLDDNNQYAQ